MAPGRRPGQHDAVPGPAVQPRAGLPAGPAASSPPRRSPKGSRPPAGWRCRPSSAGCCASGPRPARRVRRPAATPAAPDPDPALERPPDRAAGAGGVLGLLVGSNIVENVTNNEAGATPLYIGSLACTDLEPLWLEAQSVPSASLVPCVRSLPAGWTVASDGQQRPVSAHPGPRPGRSPPPWWCG